MRDYAQWCLIVLFFALTVYFLCLDFLWMREGKPTRWKNGYTIVRVLSIVEIALLITAILFSSFAGTFLWCSSLCRWHILQRVSIPLFLYRREKI